MNRSVRASAPAQPSTDHDQTAPKMTRGTTSVKTSGSTECASVKIVLSRLGICRPATMTIRAPSRMYVLYGSPLRTTARHPELHSQSIPFIRHQCLRSSRTCSQLNSYVSDTRNHHTSSAPYAVGRGGPVHNKPSRTIDPEIVDDKLSGDIFSPLCHGEVEDSTCRERPHAPRPLSLARPSPLL